MEKEINGVVARWNVLNGENTAYQCKECGTWYANSGLSYSIDPENVKINTATGYCTPVNDRGGHNSIPVAGSNFEDFFLYLCSHCDPTYRFDGVVFWWAEDTGRINERPATKREKQAAKWNLLKMLRFHNRNTTEARIK